MSERNELHCYEYVTAPYEEVAGALRRDAIGLFQRATAEAAARADELVATLRVGIGPIEISADVKVSIIDVKEVTSAFGEHSTRLQLIWAANRAAALFPYMEATLSVYPLSAQETQLDLHGRYHPPLGILGNAVDGLVMHRLAQASVLRFVQDVAMRLRAELPKDDRAAS